MRLLLRLEKSIAACDWESDGRQMTRALRSLYSADQSRSFTFTVLNLSLILFMSLYRSSCCIDEVCSV